MNQHYFLFTRTSKTRFAPLLRFFTVDFIQSTAWVHKADLALVIHLSANLIVKVLVDLNIRQGVGYLRRHSTKNLITNMNNTNFNSSLQKKPQQKKLTNRRKPSLIQIGLFPDHHPSPSQFLTLVPIRVYPGWHVYVKWLPNMLSGL